LVQSVLVDTVLPDGVQELLHTPFAVGEPPMLWQ
jgi:hypothetical protein